MFRIYRYLATASAIVLLLALVMVAWFYNHQAVRDLIEIAELHNIDHSKALSKTVWSRYGDYLTSAGDLDIATLPDRPETREIHETLRALTEEFSILKVKIYGPDGLTIYSTDRAQIGEDNSQNPGFAASALRGEPRSALSFKDRISAFSGELFERDLVETYIPVALRNGQIVGVFEIYADVTDVKERIDRATINMLLGLVVIFGALYGVLVLGIMRRAIAPVRLASDYAARIGPRSSGVRLPTQGMPNELLPLIKAMNGALDRLDRALDTQRQFSADAAHELLTPLAVLRANLETLGDEEAVAALRDDVIAMSAVVTQLLELAELEGPNASDSEAVSLQDVCTEVISMIAPVAYKETKSLALSGAEPPVKVRCNRAILVRALRNLVENAVAHTPAGTAVKVEVAGDGAVHVTDQGPGVPPQQRDLVFRRFWRGSDRTGPGAGLGLFIVKRIADTYDGEVTVADAPGGGAVFTLRLPLAGDA